MYKEMYEKVLNSGLPKHLVVDIHSWHEPGDVLVGKIIKIEPFKAGKYDADVFQYILETDDGLVSTVLGRYTDQQLDGKVGPDDVIAITFKGQVSLDDGRKVNRFDVVKLNG